MGGTKDAATRTEARIKQPSGGRDSAASGRVVYLDGLRGFAALIVVIYHFLCGFVPIAIPNQAPLLAPITDTPAGFFYNGPFAVIIFFVLSGFVVSNAASKSSDPLIVNLFSRYVRLAVPATASLVLAWVLLSLMPDAPRRLSLAIPHPWFDSNGMVSETRPSLRSFLHTDALQAFKYGGAALNSALWTMQFELIGSWFLYTFYRIVETRFRIPLLLLGSLICQCAVLFQTPHWAARLPSYTGFLVGALFFEYWSRGRLPSIFPFGVFIAGGLLGAFHTGFHDRMKLPQGLGEFTVGNHEGVFYLIGSAMMIYGCMQSGKLRWFFSSVPMKFLGRVSFSLYLVHLPLLLTVFAAIYLRWLPRGTMYMSGMFVLFLLVIILVAAGMTWAVDEPVLSLIASTKKTVRRMRGSFRREPSLG